MESLLMEKVAYLYYELDINVEQIQHILLNEYNIDLDYIDITRLLSEI
jgi:hypothetical protein